MEYSLESYSPPLSVWSVITANVPENEIFEAKRVLGEDLIDQSNELREQIRTLLEIYKDYRESQTTSPPIVSRLPEPPDVRSRITQEILFFVEGIREQAKNQGRDPNKVLDVYNKNIIDYAYESGSSRPSTANTSRPSTSRSSALISPFSSSGGSSCRNLRESCNNFDDLKIQGKFNYLSFDEIKQTLRQHLQDELAQLHEDFIQIQLSFCQEDNVRSQSTMAFSREPTLSELKEERHKLEEGLLESSRRTTTATVHSSGDGPLKSKSQLISHNGKSGHLKPMKARVDIPPVAPLKSTTNHLQSRQDSSHNEGNVNSALDTMLAKQKKQNDKISNSQDTNRPSSAQKLRKMVFEAREYKKSDGKS